MTNSLRSIWRKLFSGTISRLHYAFYGSVLLFLKTTLDWTLGRFAFHKPWDNFWSVGKNYYFLGDTYGSTQSLMSHQNELAFHFTLLVLALPFMLFGLSLTAKRLNALGIHPWMLILFFIPFIQLLFFGLITFLPDEDPARVKKGQTQKGDWLSPYLPRSPYLAALVAGGLTAAFGAGVVYLSTNVFNVYGGFLFVGLPFSLGFLSTLLFSTDKEVSFKAHFVVALGGLFVVAFLLLIFAMEGLVCLLMATPLALPLMALGVYCARSFKKPKHLKPGQAIALITFLLPSLMGFESATLPKPAEWVVKSSLLIKADPEKVWKTVIAFPDIPAPKEFIFRAGISYPTHATIEGKGPGALRKCHFNTGYFLEPITIWKEPQILAFDVTSEPEPMSEMSFYKHVHAPHLDGYFESHHGRFDLTKLSDGSTLLEGTTWYTHAIWPEAYWRVISDSIIHTIHMRVLNHIKKVAEES